MSAPVCSLFQSSPIMVAIRPGVAQPMLHCRPHIGAPWSVFLGLQPGAGLTTPISFQGEISCWNLDCRKAGGSSQLPGEVIPLVIRSRSLLSNYHLVGGPRLMEREREMWTILSPQTIENFIGFLTGSPTCPDFPRTVLVFKTLNPMSK